MKRRVMLVGNVSKKGCALACKEAKNILLNHGIQLAGMETSRHFEWPKGKIDMLLCLGGDGSMLHLAAEVVRRNIPVMGINFGRLGFLTAGVSEQIEMLILQWLEGQLCEIDLMCLNIKVPKLGLKTVAVNDVVICSPDLRKVFGCSASLGNEHLFHTRGDGLIISTPTGSTAHSLSAGGALVDPQLELMQLIPMNPQSLSSRPLTVSPDREIVVELASGTPKGTLLCDGQHFAKIKAGDQVVVSRATGKFRLLQPRGYAFFNRLREKLGWNLNPVYGMP